MLIMLIMLLNPLNSLNPLNVVKFLLTVYIYCYIFRLSPESDKEKKTMRTRFERIDNGYRCKPDWKGYGYFIQSDSDFDNHPYYAVFKLRGLKKDVFGKYDTYRVKEVTRFDALKEAKEYCFTNAR